MGGLHFRTRKSKNIKWLFIYESVNDWEFLAGPRFVVWYKALPFMWAIIDSMLVLGWATHAHVLLIEVKHRNERFLNAWQHDMVSRTIRLGKAGNMSCKVLESYLTDACLSIFSTINLGEALPLNIIRMNWLIAYEQCFELYFHLHFDNISKEGVIARWLECTPRWAESALFTWSNGPSLKTCEGGLQVHTPIMHDPYAPFPPNFTK